jgi:hypothetical protein
MVGEAFDVEGTRIAQEKVHPHERGPIVYPIGNGITRFVIRAQGGEIRIQSRLELLPILQLVNSKNTEGLTYDPGS